MATCLSRVDFDVSTLVFGVDTVVDPSTAEDVRQWARELYDQWFRELAELRNCTCCRDLALGSVRIEIPLGVDRYYGWRFEASIDSVFNYAFHTIVNELEKCSYRWVFLDLTHGVSYLLISVLYAALASAILLRYGGGVIMVNFQF